MSGGDERTTCPTCNHVLGDTVVERCPECGQPVNTGGTSSMGPGLFSLPPMRYPNSYTWLVFVSALDLILTMLVLYVWGGYELNPIAGAVIDTMGFMGAVALKFGIVILVIIICEVIGRRDDHSGQALAVGAIVISAIPVVYTFALLLRANAFLSHSSQLILKI